MYVHKHNTGNQAKNMSTVWRMGGGEGEGEEGEGVGGGQYLDYVWQDCRGRRGELHYTMQTIVNGISTAQSCVLYLYA